MVHSKSLGCDSLEIERWYAGGFAIGTAAAESAKNLSRQSYVWRRPRHRQHLVKHVTLNAARYARLTRRIKPDATKPWQYRVNDRANVRQGQASNNNRRQRN
jgi:hypothetical protein